MLIFNANSLHKIFVTVLILYWISTFFAFRAYLLEPPLHDYILVRGKLKKSQNSNEVKNGCINSRVRIENSMPTYFSYFSITYNLVVQTKYFQSWFSLAKKLVSNFEIETNLGYWFLLYFGQT